LLLELYTEEIPAMMQKAVEKGFEDIYNKALSAESIDYTHLKTYIGPRRITLHIDGLQEELEAQNIEIKGPKSTAPDSAIDGFCRSKGIGRDSLVIKGECYFYEKKIEARSLKSVLPKIIVENIGKYVWPKSMYWGDYKVKWVRPLLNILCILDGEILALEYAHLKANNKSFGHRFADYNAFEVKSFADYKEQLHTKHVILDRAERLELISTSIKKLEAKHNIQAFDEPKLLEEVAGLNEHINVLVGEIDKRFLHIPPEALVSSMKTHQKFFPCKDATNGFAPYFIFVSNVPGADNNEIIRGNEKVLSARLADALYFYEQDQKTPLKDRDLSKIVFHANIGTMQDKVGRLIHLAEYFDKGNEDLVRAASLCKSDLVSEMVGEFPELQGIMGDYYAKQEGENKEIALAIRDHYKPMGTDDLPKGLAAKLALIDKIDSLVGLMVAGERATGSKDPFALRRMALGIIRIILAEKLDVNLTAIVDLNYTSFATSSDIKPEIILFIEDRLKNYYKDTYDTQVIRAAIDLSLEDNILITDLKLRFLDEFSKSQSGLELIEVYRRVTNILSDEKFDKIDVTLFNNTHEKNLYNKLLGIIPNVKASIGSSDFSKAFNQILDLKTPLTSFFDNVMVNDNDPIIAQNRKAMLFELSNLFKQIAHFEYL